MAHTGPDPAVESTLGPARAVAESLAKEQAALRRVATLVAKGTSPPEVFASVADEVSEILELPLCTVARFASDGEAAIVVGAAGDHPQQAGISVSLDQPSAAGLVRRTGRPARVDGSREITGQLGDDGRSMTVTGTAAAPIIVDGEVWGAVAAGTDAPEGLPAAIEERLTQFTELVATAISNAQARTELRSLADEHAALRRVAVLVAAGAEESTIFECVCEEAARLLDASTSNVVLWRNGIRLTKAGWSLRGVHVKPGTRMEIDHDTLDGRVYRTASPQRIDSYTNEPGKVAAMLRRNGIQAQVAAPVIVDGEVWGVLIVGTDKPMPMPAGTEARLAAFTELIATAVSNAAAKAELLASRARIVEAADEQRRRVVRDLHDGAQQRLVHTVITLQQALAESGSDPAVESLVRQALQHADQAITELRELAHGIHPAILTHRGLEAAIKGLADRAPLPVMVDIPAERFAIPVESAAYFVAAEALTNIAKYSEGAEARISAEVTETDLVLMIEDDGIGGARVPPGRGLSGLFDRVSALDGTLQIDSPRGQGTTIRAAIPLAGPGLGSSGSS